MKELAFILPPHPGQFKASTSQTFLRRNAVTSSALWNFLSAT